MELISSTLFLFVSCSCFIFLSLIIKNLINQFCFEREIRLLKKESEGEWKEKFCVDQKSIVKFNSYEYIILDKKTKKEISTKHASMRPDEINFSNGYIIDPYRSLIIGIYDKENFYEKYGITTPEKFSSMIINKSGTFVAALNSFGGDMYIFHTKSSASSSITALYFISIDFIDDNCIMGKSTNYEKRLTMISFTMKNDLIDPVIKNINYKLPVNFNAHISCNYNLILFEKLGLMNGEFDLYSKLLERKIGSWKWKLEDFHSKQCQNEDLCKVDFSNCGTKVVTSCGLILYDLNIPKNALLILLLARSYSYGSHFHKSFLPLDLFKEIFFYVFCGDKPLLPKKEE